MNVDRLEELLVLRATQALDDETRRELDQLLTAQMDLTGEEFDRAAAAVDLLSMQEFEPMPASVRHSVELDAARYFAELIGN